MVFLIEWDIKIHAKGEVYWIVDLRGKTSSSLRLCRMWSFLCQFIAWWHWDPGLLLLSPAWIREPVWDIVVDALFTGPFSLWASDMQINLTLKEVPMETKKSLLTLCRDGEERGELSMEFKPALTYTDSTAWGQAHGVRGTNPQGSAWEKHQRF